MMISYFLRFMLCLTMQEHKPHSHGGLKKAANFVQFSLFNFACIKFQRPLDVDISYDRRRTVA